MQVSRVLLPDECPSLSTAVMTSHPIKQGITLVHKTEREEKSGMVLRSWSYRERGEEVMIVLSVMVHGVAETCQSTFIIECPGGGRAGLTLFSSLQAMPLLSWWSQNSHEMR